VHHAAKTSNPDVFRLLLAAGADINARDKAGNTPLLAVVSWFHCRIFSLPPDSNTRITTLCLLLDAGADINAANIEGKTALHTLASKYGDPSISRERKPQMLDATRFFLAMRANTEAVDRNGKTVLDLSTEDSEFAKMVKSAKEDFVDK
jgi:ankyrin repeat protein